MKLLDIAEVSRQTGVAASTLRYYEEQGLIESMGRRGLKRLFEPNIALKLSFISLGKAAGFSLEDIKGMIGANGQPKISRDKLFERVAELDDQIKRLQKLREAVKHVAECPHPSHMDCGKFQKLLQIGARRRPARAGKPSAPGRSSDKP
ncbi:helix-turn-helix domain-containing protein [Roseibium polysiphoniae]|uniref:Helix-turn-helix domain-containing protein n=1 Tax=Roseibium polysiphoniae TaxID=2571221 RepID=A0ABR9C6T3_9HYPH|nr:helix-turn-helix domain-containing protein [Roseibium polysiphoniae]MBD8875621.1 helix-turn-helix domain-containing protein [Roseibium polysiphoniae]